MAGVTEKPALSVLYQRWGYVTSTLKYGFMATGVRVVPAIGLPYSSLIRLVLPA
ncbi:MAG: hypothetical protein ACO331_10480 [Prochlorothrix sp.]